LNIKRWLREYNWNNWIYWVCYKEVSIYYVVGFHQAYFLTWGVEVDITLSLINFTPWTTFRHPFFNYVQKVI
jgi:hypothetical protein